MRENCAPGRGHCAKDAGSFVLRGGASAGLTQAAEL
jgi:hypothetical protein